MFYIIKYSDVSKLILTAIYENVQPIIKFCAFQFCQCILEIVFWRRYG